VSLYYIGPRRHFLPILALPPNRTNLSHAIHTSKCCPHQAHDVRPSSPG